MPASSSPRRIIKKKAETRVQRKKPEQVKVTCSMCGQNLVRGKKFFYKSAHKIFAGNGGYVTFCKDCCRELLREYKDALGSTDLAIERMCMYTGMYYSEDVMSRLDKTLDIDTVYSKYLMQMRKTNDRNKTYDNSLHERMMTNMGEFETPKRKIVNQDKVSFWGKGFSPDEYDLLDKHYAEMREQYTFDDAITDIYLKDLCELKVLQERALSGQEYDDWMKYKNLYQKTAKEANLNPKKNKNETLSAEQETWGTFVAMVESQSPAEYYKDKNKYIDFLGIKKSFKMDVLRPLKNLLTGSKDADPENNVEMIGGDLDDG